MNSSVASPFLSAVTYILYLHIVFALVEHAYNFTTQVTQLVERMSYSHALQEGELVASQASALDSLSRWAFTP